MSAVPLPFLDSRLQLSLADIRSKFFTLNAFIFSHVHVGLLQSGARCCS